MATPSPNGSNGRTAGGPGNPHGRRVETLRAALLDAVTDDDLQAIVTKLVEMAKGGDLRAMKEVLDRTLGKPPAAVSLEVSAAGHQLVLPERARLVEDADWYGTADIIEERTAEREAVAANAADPSSQGSD